MEALQNVLSTFDAVLGSYEEYRKYRIVAYATDTRRFLPLVERAYLARQGFGFMTVLGRNPAAGRVCFLKTAGWDPQVMARGMVAPESVPESVRALPTWPKGPTGAESFDIVQEDNLERGFLGVPESKGRDPTFNADCNLMVGPKARLALLKARIEQKNGIGIVLFEETIDKAAYDQASVAYQAARANGAGESVWVGQDAKISADYHQAYEYHRSKGNLPCMTATDTVIRNATRRGGGPSQWLSEQAHAGNASDCVQAYFQRK